MWKCGLHMADERWPTAGSWLWWWEDDFWQHNKENIVEWITPELGSWWGEWVYWRWSAQDMKGFSSSAKPHQTPPRTGSSQEWRDMFTKAGRYSQLGKSFPEKLVTMQSFLRELKETRSLSLLNNPCSNRSRNSWCYEH